MVRDNGYRQLIDNPTTDNNTLIDHIYTNIVNVETVSGNPGVSWGRELLILH